MEINNVLLSESTICRLCGEHNENGISLFSSEDSNENLAAIINKYLPIQVERNEKLPSILCPGCTIQLEATKSFFDLIIEGQNKIRNLIIEQEESLKIQFNEKEKLENALQMVNSTNEVQSYKLETDENGDNYFIQIFSEAPIFPADQEILLNKAELEKPKKKRGRPHKPPQKEKPEPLEKIVLEESKTDLEGKRKIKKPSRYIELLEGKELEDMLKKEGIFDGDNVTSNIENEVVENSKTRRKHENVIGLMEGENGENLGHLVTVKNKCKVIKKQSIENTAIKKIHKCEICGLVFKNNNQLRVHFQFHKSFYYCCKSRDCFKKFETKVALDEHQKKESHFGYKFEESIENIEELDELEVTINPGLESPFLNKKLELETIEVLPSKTLEVDTLQIEQPIEEDLQSNPDTNNETSDIMCKNCNTKFDNLPSLEKHSCSPNIKSYKCLECPRVFHHRSSLIYHRGADHNNGTKFVCLTCNKPFKQKQLLLKHQTVHSNDRPHSCSLCGATFKTSGNLLNHMLIHTGEKKHTCSECGYNFSHKTSLSLHMRMHKGIKPFKCQVCSKCFTQKGNLAEHERIHTGEKPYACPYCGRKFTTSSQCFLHVKRHTGEKPWQCEYCLKKFLHKETWVCHRRRHRNETPFQCKQCLRSFSEQWSLRKHERIHTGEKPYKCDVCQKCFADSSNLRKHKKIHQNAPPLIKAESAEKEVPSECLQLYYEVDEEKQDPLVQIVDSNDDQQMLLNDAIIPTNNDEISMDLQIQHLIDNDGNSVMLSTDSGEKIKVVSTIINNESSLQGLMNDGTLIPLNLSSDGKSIIFGNDEEKKSLSNSNILPLKVSNQKKVEILNNTTYKPGNKQAVFDMNKLEYVDADPENVCLIMPFDDDEDVVEESVQNEFVY